MFGGSPCAFRRRSRCQNAPERCFLARFSTQNTRSDGDRGAVASCGAIPASCSIAASPGLSSWTTTCPSPTEDSIARSRARATFDTHLDSQES